jgi:hypothetical protein
MFVRRSSIPTEISKIIVKHWPLSLHHVSLTLASFSFVILQLLTAILLTTGVFLRTHSFIQEGSPDFLDNGIINFRKREMTAEVINDIKRWQCKPHHFHPLPLVLAFLKRSLLKVSDCDSLWALSLEREPQESPGDKRIRLSLESGLL